MSMFAVSLAALQTAVATRLPKEYEPLTLTFYGLGSRQKGDHITFASDGFSDLCVNARDGCVYAMDPSGKRGPRFVNAGLEQFIAFFHAYTEHAEKIREADRKGAKDYWDLVRAMRPALEAVDKEALCGEGRYWAPLVESVEEENQQA
jgi:hypothetical protein